MDQEKINQMLDLHQKWLNDEPDGVQADFSNMDLKKADFTHADCRYADFSEADCQGANFSEANCQNANFAYANCQKTIFRYIDCQFANFIEANCQKANFRFAKCQNANFREADCQGAVFTLADCRYADFTLADCQDAYFSDTDCRNAVFTETDLQNAKLPDFQIVPEVGSFRGFKKVDGKIVELEIPAEAKRTSSLVGRKCRCEFARVINISDNVKEVNSVYNALNGLKTTYKIGELVYPDSYDDDIRVECTHGIHFFITKKEAEEY